MATDILCIKTLDFKIEFLDCCFDGSGDRVGSQGTSWFVVLKISTQHCIRLFGMSQDVFDASDQSSYWAKMAANGLLMDRLRSFTIFLVGNGEGGGRTRVVELL